MTMLANADEPEAAVKAIAFPRCPDIGIVNVQGKGRGVVATALIPAGTVLEVSPVLRLTRQESKVIEPTIIDKYIFRWIDEPALEHPDGEDPGVSLYNCAVSFGIMSIFNHSEEPNALRELDISNQLIKMTALRDIYPDEEITHDYGCQLWFEVKE